MILEELLKKLKELNLPEDQLVIVGSGPLGIRGLKECRDLDVLVTDELWQELAQKYLVKNDGEVDKIELSPGIEVLGAGTIFRDESISSVEETIKSADIIDGIRFLNLELLKKFKQKLGREKDLKDIETIDKYLND